MSRISALSVPRTIEPNDDRSSFEFVGTFMARDALALAAECLSLTRSDVVLLPAFLCKEVYRPFARTSRVTFYDVRDDLSVDPGVIAQALETAPARLVIIINYFGVLQPERARIAAVCADRGAYLLEDCAHSFLTTGSGTVGDMSVVSYRKLLPVYDGGGIAIRRGCPPLDAVSYPRLYSDALSVLAAAKSLARLRSAGLSRGGLADRRESWAGRSQARRHRYLPTSRFATHRAANAPRARIIEQRQSGYRFWQHVSAATGAWRPLFGAIDGETCPTGYPILSSKRDEVAALLHSLGVHTSVQWSLLPALGAECANSHRISAEVLTLPVYPPIAPQTRDRIEATFGKGELR